MPEWERIVYDMLGLPRPSWGLIPAPVLAHLERIEALCAASGGHLRSRQLIALVLTMYGADIR